MVGVIKDNGATESNMEKESLSVQKEYLVKENGKTVKDYIGKMK